MVRQLHKHPAEGRLVMTNFQHILFPVDFSDRCHAIRPFVKEMARESGAKLTLLNVIHIPAGWYGAAEGAYPIMLDFKELEKNAADAMRQFFDASELGSTT